jgi:hypothetical protein
MEIIEKGIYRHFKGSLVRVLGVAKHSETLEDFVVYNHQGTNELSDMWIRPASMFLEEVEYEWKRVKRFEFVGEY